MIIETVVNGTPFKLIEEHKRVTVDIDPDGAFHVYTEKTRIAENITVIEEPKDSSYDHPFED